MSSLVSFQSGATAQENAPTPEQTAALRVERAKQQISHLRELLHRPAGWSCGEDPGGFLAQRDRWQRIVENRRRAGTLDRPADALDAELSAEAVREAGQWAHAAESARAAIREWQAVIDAEGTTDKGAP